MSLTETAQFGGQIQRPLRWRLLRRLAVVTAVAAVSLLLNLSPAVAHTDLVTSDPADGVQLSSPPSDIRLIFNAEIAARLGTIAVTVGDRAPQQVNTRVDGATFIGEDVAAASTDIRSGEPEPWQVDYRVISRDGHPVTGVIRFTVAPGASPPGGETAAPGAGATPSPPMPADSAAPAATEDESEPMPLWLFALLAAPLVLVPFLTALAAWRSKKQPDE